MFNCKVAFEWMIRHELIQFMEYLELKGFK